jgi:hypothetical protein
VADVEYTLELVEELRFVVKVAGAPVQRMANGRLEAAFASF